MKNIQSQVLQLLVFIISALPCFGQEKYSEAVLVTKHNDTLYCKAIYEDWKVIPEKIVFIHPVTGKRDYITLEELLAVNFDNYRRTYVRKNITYNLYRKEIEENENPVLEEISAPSMLELLIKTDSISFYRFWDKDKNKRFFLEINGKISELIYYKFNLRLNDKLFQKHVQEYKKQLIEILQNCNSVDLTDLVFTETSIKSKLIEHSLCNKSQYSSDTILKSVQYNLYLKEVIPGQSPIAQTIKGTRKLKPILKSDTITLFKLIDENKAERFFIEINDSITELISYSYILHLNHSSPTVKITSYKDQLSKMLSGCEDIDFAKLQYSEKALKNKLLEFFNCASVFKSSPQEKEKVSLHISLGAGFLFYKANGASINAAFEMRFPRNFNNTYLTAEFQSILTRFYKGEKRENLQQITTLNVLFGSYFGPYKIQPFFQGGLIFDFKHKDQILNPILSTGISYKKQLKLEVRSSSYQMILGSYTF